LPPKQIAKESTMALTQADLDALDATIASGTLTSTYSAARVTFQTVDALLKARAHVAAVLRSQAGRCGGSFCGVNYGVADFSRS
jgi:hypothetical protein